MDSDAIGPLDRLWERLLQGLGLAACTLVGLMVLVICADVGARAFALGNLPWAAELAEYALYLCTFLAAPWLLRQGRHVRMDMVLRALPARVGWALELAADILAAATCAALAAAGFKAAIASAEQGSLVLKIFVFPEWWLVIPAAAMFAVLAVEFLFRLRRQWYGPRAVRDEATSAA